MWQDGSRLYANAMHLYNKEPEHLWILVSSGGPGANSLWILGNEYNSQ